ncbi:MAG: tRNA (guanosine(37)-N1)-methyltransferase TrmD [Alphaproteobacteria bacterium]|nr:tRNA (guanosine(37)-N1)-methyltransferase TrmD [Alphaproteobacteria bacterium]
MRFDVLTLHPDMVMAPLSTSMIGRARDAGLLEVAAHDIRDHATDRWKTVDDTPYGGGAGMVMKVDIVAAAIEAVRTDASRVLLTSPAGRPITQADCIRWSKLEHVVIVTGHYEGIDARIESLVDEEVSLGDFVLTGGEIAAIAIVDAVGRLVPGVLGNADSAADESFSQGLLEYPQYTRPREFRGMEVPEVLVSGHHGRIAVWREERSRERTRERRPDLWEAWLARTVGDPIVD